MHWEARLRQQRRQFEHFEPVTGDFRLAIDAGFGFGSFVAALQFVEKLLRVFAAGLPAFGARHHRLRGIGADKLWPILLQQLGARENISPHNFSIHRDHDAHRVLIAQLADDAFVVALYWLSDGLDLLLHFFVVHYTSIRRSRVHFRGSWSWDTHCHCVLRFSYAVPDLLLNLGGHRVSAHARRSEDTATDAAPTKLDLTIRRHPTSGFDAENTQVDRIALSGHDTVFADHAILLAASHYLASEK